VLTIDLDRAGVRSGCRVLDLGCGAGRHAFATAKLGARTVAFDADRTELAGVDAMLDALRAAGEIGDGGSCAIAGDALGLPFKSGSFDVVIASEVLEHIVEDQAALGEIARVLEPGGTFALSVPRRFPERVNWALSSAYHETQGGHVRIYERRDLVGRVTRAGFSVTGSHYRHGLHSPFWWLRCVVGVEREDHPLVAAYHRFLVWDIVRRPPITRALEAVLDPLIGKSLVLYFTRRS